MKKISKATLFSILVLVAIVGLFFYQTIFTGKIPAPTDTLVGLYHPWRDVYSNDYPRGVPFKNFLITDPVRQQIPWRRQVIETIKQGQIPGWNPYSYLGASLKANIQAAPFYPLNIIFFVFPFDVAWTFLIVLQPLLGGIFMYLFLYSLGLTHPSSILGAIVFMFSGFSVSWMTWGTIGHVVSWLPLLLLSIHRFFLGVHNKKYTWPIIGIIASVCFIILAGHAQIALYCIGVGGFFFLWKFNEGGYKREIRGELLRKFIGAMCVSLAVSSIQWAPLAASALASSRIDGSVNATREGWFLPWQHIITILIPDFFGNPATLNYWGIWNYGELSGYVGIVPFILATYIIVCRKIGRPWVVLLITGFLFMVKNPISSVFSSMGVPILGTLQPTRLMIIVDFVLAILAAYGLNHIMNEKDTRVRSVLIGTSFVFVAAIVWVLYMSATSSNDQMLANIAVAKRNQILPVALFVVTVLVLMMRRVLPIRIQFVIPYLLIIITIFDLLRFAWKFTPFTDRSYFFPKTRIIEFLENQPKPFRIMTMDDRILPPNVSAYFGIESVDGYDPLVQKRYEQFLYMSENGKANTTGASPYNRIHTLRNISSPLLPMWNVRFVLSFAPIEHTDFRLVASEGETKVYEFTKHLPRAYLAESIMPVVGKSEREVLETAALLSGAYKNAVVEQNISVLSVPLTADEMVHIDQYQPNTIKFTTSAVNPRLMVVLNSFDPNWRVKINDVPSQVVRVNYQFLGVVVPAGVHTVSLSYR